MNPLIKYFTLILIPLLLSCAGPRSYTKKGNKFYEADLNNYAVDMYIRALKKKPDYVNAVIGLKKASKKVMSEFQTELFKTNANGELKKHIYLYIEMEKFVKRANYFNAKLNVPSHLESDYKRNKEKYLKQRFEEASSLLSDENFAAAEQVFIEIRDLDEHYKGGDLNEMMEISRLEPLYRKGTNAFANELYRTAYHKFNDVVNASPTYKDSKIRREESLELAKYPIALLNFKNYSTERGAHEKVSSQIISGILNKNDPFIQLIDRQNTEAFLNEQHLSLEGEVTSSTAAKAGELIGAKAVLTGKIIEVQKIEKRPYPERRKAYEQYKVKRYNPTTESYYFETKHRKVYYTHYYGYNKVVVTFQYQLVSSETGEILLSGVKSEESKSEINYAQYNGNINKLVPGTWKNQTQFSPGDKIERSRLKKMKFRKNFSGNKTATPIKLMADKIYPKIASHVANKIVSFNPEIK